MPKPKKIQYSGESKVINAIVNIANWLLDNYYELPVASADVLGGVKVGQNLSIDENGVLSAESGGTTVVANPVGTPTDQLNTIQIGEGIYEIVGGGSSGASIEIIPITGGTDTTSRTFIFDKTPKKIAVTYDSADSSPWCGHWDFTWGDQYAFGLCNSKSVGSGATIVRAGLTYGADNKSFTVTGGNAFQAWNQSGSVRGGFMLVDYGEGGGSGSGNAITYGVNDPTESGNDGDLHIVLNPYGTKRGEYLYETNAWVLIDGKRAFDGTIYDEGYEGIDLTIGSTGSGSGGTKNADNISLNTGGGTFTNYAITEVALDITDYDVLHIKCHYRSQDYDQELDISSYSGLKYISFTYLTDSSHNECAVGFSDTKEAATTFRIDSRNGGDNLQSMSYLALEISE